MILSVANISRLSSSSENSLTTKLKYFSESLGNYKQISNSCRTLEQAYPAKSFKNYGWLGIAPLVENITDSIERALFTFLMWIIQIGRQCWQHTLYWWCVKYKASIEVTSWKREKATLFKPILMQNDSNVWHPNEQAETHWLKYSWGSYTKLWENDFPRCENNFHIHNVNKLPRTQLLIQSALSQMHFLLLEARVSNW